MKEEIYGKLYSVFKVLMLAVYGFSLGILTDVVLGYVFEYYSDGAGMESAVITVPGDKGDKGVNTRSMEEFLSSNPFRVTVRTPETPKPEPPKPEPPKPVEPVKATELDEIVIRGTMPGIGVWVEVKNALKLVLVGKSVEGWKVLSVNYGDVLFSRGNDEKVRKYMLYGPGVQASQQPAQARTPAPAPARNQPEPPAQSGSIVAAGPDQEGQLPAEMVSSLVQNPFDELKRIRMRPNDKVGGLEVQWIQGDSLLKRIGVQRGDVIKSVNGIPFTNMGDIANSINSLMNSERFDVEVMRGGKNTALRYVVK